MSEIDTPEEFFNKLKEAEPPERAKLIEENAEYCEDIYEEFDSLSAVLEADAEEVCERIGTVK